MARKEIKEALGPHQLLELPAQQEHLVLLGGQVPQVLGDLRVWMESLVCQVSVLTFAVLVVFASLLQCKQIFSLSAYQLFTNIYMLDDIINFAVLAERERERVRTAVHKVHDAYDICCCSQVQQEHVVLLVTEALLETEEQPELEVITERLVTPERLVQKVKEERKDKKVQKVSKVWQVDKGRRGLLVSSMLHKLRSYLYRILLYCFDYN